VLEGDAELSSWWLATIETSTKRWMFDVQDNTFQVLPYQRI